MTVTQHEQQKAKVKLQLLGSAPENSLSEYAND